MVNEYFERALRVIPGGVNSPVRSFSSVGGKPVFMLEGKGSRLTDTQGKEYIDYVMSWGPLILGHAFPAVLEAVNNAASKGQSLGTATPSEVELAETVAELVPGIEKVRLVNSGTEAAMSAVRLARGHTKRKRIVKFAGCYHGHADSFLIQAGSGALTMGVPSSPGVPEEAAQLTLVAEYNDLSSVEELFSKYGDEIACVIVEPVCGNMGCVLPQGGFLTGLREITRDYGALLVFDEVITGFRLGTGGAQEYFGLLPDITCLGKILGGGFPVGAFGGDSEVMAGIAPEGPVYQAGTLSGGSVVTAAALSTLQAVKQQQFYERLERSAALLEEGLKIEAEKANLPVTINRIGSMLTVFFTAGPVFNSRDASRCNKKAYGLFFHEMLKEGVYLPPSPFECWFVSASHGEAEIKRTVEAAGNSFRKVAKAL